MDGETFRLILRGRRIRCQCFCAHLQIPKDAQKGICWSTGRGAGQ